MSEWDAYEAVKRICFVLGVDARSVRGPRRHRPLVRARQVCARYLRWRQCSAPEIAKAMGRRDHTSALYGLGRLGRQQEAPAQ